MPCGDAAAALSPCTIPLPSCSSVSLQQNPAHEVQLHSAWFGGRNEGFSSPQTLCATTGRTVQRQGAVLQAMSVPAIAWQTNSPGAAMSHVAPPARCAAQLLNCLEITPSSLLMSSLWTCCPRLVGRAVPMCTKLARSRVGALMHSSESLSNPFPCFQSPQPPSTELGSSGMQRCSLCAGE